MSEKRFSLKEWEDENYCEHCFYGGESELSDSDVVDKLNEQQSTINNQEQKIKILQQEIKETQAILEMLTEKLKGWYDE